MIPPENLMVFDSYTETTLEKVNYLNKNPILKDIPSWFHAGNLSKYQRPGLFTLFDKTIVIYKTMSGEYKAMNNKCIHQGASLSKGFVTGDNITCPFHHWEYSPDGKVVSAPKSYQEIKCKNKTTRTYPTTIVNGHLFIFNGPKALFELPTFEGELTSHDFLNPIKFAFDAGWFLPAANAFDLPHFEFVHFRKILKKPIVTKINKHTIKTVLELENIGHSLTDSLLRLIFGKSSRLEFTVCSGNIVLAKSIIGKTENHMFICSKGIINSNNRESEVTIFPVSKSKINIFLKYNPVHKVYRELRRYLIYKFFVSEAHNLNDVEIVPGRLLDGDKHLLDFLYWLSTTLNTSRDNSSN